MYKFLFSRIDFSILVPSLLLVGISLAALYSIDSHLFFQGLIFLGVSLIAYLFFLTIDYTMFGHYYKVILGIMIVLLLIVFLIGAESHGAIRWIQLGGFSLQLSEVIKPFFVIVVASFLSRGTSRSLVKLLLTFLLIFPIFFLTLKQPDLGNAIIFLCVTVGMLFLYGFPLSYFAGLGVVFIAPLPFLYNFLHDYQKQRILSFFNHTQDPSGSSYNTIQALISIGSGGLLGKGFGNSTQSILQFLPERHTDFIFSSITESLGFVGGVIILALYAFLLYRIYRISQDVDDEFSYLVLMGFFFILIIHMFFNIGMNMGILPIVGITLPFLSYGGSSLLTNFIILGIISSISYSYKKKRLFEIK
jgi:rod shape determining protein RodA